MTVISESQVVKACRTLFGKDVDISRDFLYYVQPSGVKSAYRKKAKENHPDLFTSHPLAVQQKQTSLFREILDAYDVLNRFFKQRELRSWREGMRPFSEQTRTREERSAQSSSQTSPFRNGDDIYYKGGVPHRTLQIGHYLYYSGKIAFGALIKALIWQRKQRPSIGDTAVQWGWLEPEGVDRIFKLCGKSRLFGEKAVELGLLTIFQVNTILLYQRSQQSPLGSYFVENKLLKPEELDRLVQELKEHNGRILAKSSEKRYRRVVFS